MNKNSGFSLIELMITAAILSFIGLTFSTMIVQQNSQVKSLGEKMLTVEVDQSIKKLMSNNNFCSCAFRNKTFNVGAKTFSPPLAFIPNSYTYVPTFPAACGFTAGDFLVPPVGSVLPGTNITINSLNVDNITEIVPGSGQYTADIGLQYGGMVRELKNPKTKINFSINTLVGVPTARPFLNCSVSGQNDWPSGSFCIIQAKAQPCPTGFLATNPGQSPGGHLVGESSIVSGAINSATVPGIRPWRMTRSSFVPDAQTWAWCCK